MEDDNNIRELSAADALEWCYRGEGARNIVLSHRSSNPLLVGKVLRLKKILRQSKEKPVHDYEKPVLSKYEQIVWAEWPSVIGATNEETLLQAYARDVMSPLLGYKIVDPGVIVSVSSDFLQKVANHVHPARPIWRAKMSEIDFCSHHALLLSDHTLFWSSTDTGKSTSSGVSVEIKPKCGFLPSSDVISANNSVKKVISRFAMHQILKYSQGQVKSISNYSPLDLFSGNFDRISRAVNDLFGHPQNNLRVFVDGKFFGDMVSDLHAETPDFDPLNETLRGFVSCEKQIDAVEVLKSLVSQSLYETDALSNLLAAQKLDLYDIEGAIHAYNKICQIHNDKSSICQLDARLEEPIIEFVNSLNLEESVKIVRDYLIAATAKDCSVMLTFQLVSNHGPENKDTQQYKVMRCRKTGGYYRFKIRFVDLDLKPLKKMPHYYKLDRDIVKAYLSRVKNGN